MCSEHSSEKQKNLSYPYTTIQRTGAITRPIFTQVPGAGLVSPPSKMSPFLLWKPGDHRPSRNQIWGAYLSVSSHQPTLTSVSGISPQGAPLEHRTCPECKLYSQSRLTCEQWGDTLLCSVADSGWAFPKVIGKSVVLWLLFPTVVLLLFFINKKMLLFSTWKTHPGFIRLGFGSDQGMLTCIFTHRYNTS